MAYESYLKATSNTQQLLAGESIRKNHHTEAEGWMPIIRVEQQISVDHNKDTGGYTSNTYHGPIHFTKQWGASSPMWLNAIENQDVFSEVVYEAIYTAEDSDDDTEVFMNITLMEARIVAYRRFQQDAKDISTVEGTGAGLGYLELETISLTYNTIDQTHGPSGKTGHASWTE